MALIGSSCRYSYHHYLRPLMVAVALLLSAGNAFATSYTWTGTVSTDWFTPGNWTPAGVPGAGDTAAIATGTASLATGATVAGLTLSGGELGGSGALTVSGAASWTGGTISGTLNIASGAMLDVGGSAGAVKLLAGPANSAGTLNNAGTMTVSSAIDWRVQSGAVFNNSGTCTLQGDVDLTHNGSAASSVNNSGTFSKAAGSGTSTINTIFNNSGTVNANSGTLDLTTYTQTADSTNLSGGNLGGGINLRYGAAPSPAWAPSPAH